MKAEHTSLPTGSLGIHPLQPPRRNPSAADCGTVQTVEDALSGKAHTGVLFIDNLDSFSLNIADAITQTGRNVTVLEGASTGQRAVA